MIMIVVVLRLNPPVYIDTGGGDTSILHLAFISIFIALWAVTTHYVTILMPVLLFYKV